MNARRLARLRRVIEIHNVMKNSFFWTPPGHASARRIFETQNSDEFEFVYNGKVIYVNQRTVCSCKNIYYKLGILENGRKRDIRCLKKIVAECDEGMGNLPDGIDVKATEKVYFEGEKK